MAFHDHIPRRYDTRENRTAAVVVVLVMMALILVLAFGYRTPEQVPGSSPATTPPASGQPAPGPTQTTSPPVPSAPPAAPVTPK